MYRCWGVPIREASSNFQGVLCQWSWDMKMCPYLRGGLISEDPSLYRYIYQVTTTLKPVHKKGSTGIKRSGSLSTVCRKKRTPTLCHLCLG